MSTTTDPRIVSWFRRTCGTWSSERRYLFNLESNRPSIMSSTFSVDELPYNKFQVSWDGNSSGIMELGLEGDTLKRSRDAFGRGSNDSTVSAIDDDTILLHTHYNRLIFREEIRLIKHDCYRLRQAVGFCDKTGVAKIVGQYFETRL